MSKAGMVTRWRDDFISINFFDVSLKLTGCSLVLSWAFIPMQKTNANDINKYRFIVFFGFELFVDTNMLQKYKEEITISSIHALCTQKRFFILIFLRFKAYDYCNNTTSPFSCRF
jgi:hypothetical protein